MAIESAFTLENGLVLNLRPVSQVTIDELIDDLGGYELQERLAALPNEEVIEYFRALPREELDEYNAALHRQTLYCLGFGVSNDPPDDAIELLKHLGKFHTVAQIRRANWLLFVAGMTRDDKNNIVGTVMALTRMSNV